MANKADNNTFEQAIQELASISDILDGQKRPKLASYVDQVSKNILGIKTAQYVGVQGYWIRNERCWSNCYRTKRTENPKMSAQEVWSDCQNEYVESINNPESGWEKYAGSDPIVKFASNDQKDIIRKESEAFKAAFMEKTAGGMDPAIAAYSSIDENMNKYATAMLDEIGKLQKVANILNEHGQTEMAEKVETIITTLTKSAQGNIWNWLGQKARGIGRALDPRSSGRARSMLMSLQKQIDDISAERDNNARGQKAVALKNQATAMLPQITALLQNDTNAAGILQSIRQLAQTGATGGNNQALAQVRSAISQFLTSPAAQQAAPAGTAAPGADPSASVAALGQMSGGTPPAEASATALGQMAGGGKTPAGAPVGAPAAAQQSNLAQKLQQLVFEVNAINPDAAKLIQQAIAALQNTLQNTGGVVSGPTAPIAEKPTFGMTPYQTQTTPVVSGPAETNTSGFAGSLAQPPEGEMMNVSKANAKMTKEAKVFLKQLKIVQQ